MLGDKSVRRMLLLLPLLLQSIFHWKQIREKVTVLPSPPNRLMQVKTDVILFFLIKFYLFKKKSNNRVRIKIIFISV